MATRRRTLTFTESRAVEAEAEVNRLAFLAEQARFTATPAERLAETLDDAIRRGGLGEVERFARWLGLSTATHTTAEIASEATR